MIDIWLYYHFNKQLHLLTHATSNLGIRLNLNMVLYLEDLANPNNGLNLVPNCL
jgi:hypothetical protein